MVVLTTRNKVEKVLVLLCNALFSGAVDYTILDIEHMVVQMSKAINAGDKYVAKPMTSLQEHEFHEYYSNCTSYYYSSIVMRLFIVSYCHLQ